jgi:hypothetical protein
MDMAESEARRTERLLLSIPIRVFGFDKGTGEFAEDTHTVVVNRNGARIALKHRVSPEDTIRIVNLETYSEADFRVVGLIRSADSDATEWGVECNEPGRNIWAIDFPPPLETQGAEAGALLECRDCHKQGFWPLSLVEVEVMESTGQVMRECKHCGKMTYWWSVDVHRRPQEAPAPEPAPEPPPSPPPSPATPAAAAKRTVERRKEKRLVVKLPILVRSKTGLTEITRTDNVSRGGAGVNLAMDLAVGEVVTVVCPYTAGASNIEQWAEVRHRAAFALAEKRRYGFRYL